MFLNMRKKRAVLILKGVILGLCSFIVPREVPSVHESRCRLADCDWLMPPTGAQLGIPPLREDKFISTTETGCFCRWGGNGVERGVNVWNDRWPSPCGELPQSLHGLCYRKPPGDGARWVRTVIPRCQSRTAPAKHRQQDGDQWEPAHLQSVRAGTAWDWQLERASPNPKLNSYLWTQGVCTEL